MKNETFCKKIWDLILTKDYVAQAAMDLDAKVWASDSLGRSQFWSIGMNEDSVFGPVQCDDPAMGYWPKEIETTLIGYTNMAFGSKIANCIIDMVKELSLEIDGESQKNLISHLCFMCCRCVAALDARCAKLNFKSFNKYFNLVALKLRKFYQLDDFSETSFPKCELIALRLLAKYVDEIFGEANDLAEDLNDEVDEDRDDTYVNCWSLQASEVLWTFRKRHYGKTIVIALSLSGVEVKTYNCYAEVRSDEIFLSSDMAEKLNMWLNDILEGNNVSSALYTAVPFGILRGNLSYSWDVSSVKEDPFNFGAPLRMSDELIGSVISLLKQRNFLCSDKGSTNDN